MTVVDLPKKKLKRATHPAPLNKSTGAARFFDRMVRDIERDLGGVRDLSRIEVELIKGFSGAATQLQYLNHQVLLGEGSDIDPSGYSQLASTMLRIGVRLGFRRRAKDVTPTLDVYCPRPVVVDDFEEDQ
jgi:hypothetical protein